MYRNWERSIVMGCILLTAGVPAWAAGKRAAAVRTVWESRDLARAAAAAPVDELLRGGRGRFQPELPGPLRPQP